MIKIKDKLDIANRTLYGLIHSPIKKVSRRNITLEHLLLGFLDKRLICKETLLIVGLNPGSKTEVIDASLHYVTNRIKIDSVIN